MSHGLAWKLPVGEMIPVLMGTGNLWGFWWWRTGGGEMKLMQGLTGESLVNETFLLALCQTLYAGWWQRTDIPQ